MGKDEENEEGKIIILLFL